MGLRDRIHKKRNSGKQRLTRALYFERCEDRELLAVFTVTNLNDGVVTSPGDQPGTLRQAVFDAADTPEADTINFQGNLNGTIELIAGEMHIPESVVINGPGASDLTIHGGNASRIFRIDAGVVEAEVEISGLTLTGGNETLFLASFGGAIETKENLTIRDSVITGNTSRVGGAISASYARLTIERTEISNNVSDFDGGGISIGGTG